VDSAQLLALVSALKGRTVAVVGDVVADEGAALVIRAAVSIAPTTSGGVATKRTSGGWVCADAMRATASIERASTKAATMSPVLPIDKLPYFRPSCAGLG